MTKDSDPNDITLSAKDCGCDPRENHLCDEHSKSQRCILGHWNQFDNCPACQVLLREEKDDEKI